MIPVEFSSFSTRTGDLIYSSLIARFFERQPNFLNCLPPLVRFSAKALRA